MYHKLDSRLAERKTGLFLLLFLSFSVAISSPITARASSSADTAETIWPLVEFQLDQEPSDTAHHGTNVYTLTSTYVTRSKALQYADAVLKITEYIRDL